ncbi:MAG TPA: DUF2157 domain-containing protein [Burkholderiales bacterium]|nr:DUF2157 domain-containing protein [Burkholderiales bacterium]
MAHQRRVILEWAGQGRIAPQNLRAALELGAVLPTAEQWRRFLDRLLLFMGAVMLAASVIFFLAYNWQDLGRYTKFGLVQALLLVALAFVWRLGLERVSGKAALLTAALLTGALLALVGQTYQTGADTYELFAAWAVAILPWVVLARFPALWILWLALVNLAVTLYFQAFGGWLGIVFGPERQLWLLFGLNTAALLAWEAAAAAGVEWLHERWPVRLIATASGVLVTVLAVMAVFDSKYGVAWSVIAWLAWLGAAYAVYRRRIKDLYMLAGGVLSMIVVVTAFLGKHLIRGEAGGFLLIGLIVIGMSAAGSYWLKNVATEEES